MNHPIIVLFLLIVLAQNSQSINVSPTKEEQCIRVNLEANEFFSGRFVVSGKKENNFSIQVKRAFASFDFFPGCLSGQ